MLRATVTGSVWSTRRLEALPNGALLEVKADDGATLIAFDVLGSGIGERVLVVTGSVASAHFAPRQPPPGAVIIGSPGGATRKGGAITQGPGVAERRA